MDDANRDFEGHWPRIVDTFRRAQASSFHCTIASVDADGLATITPIVALFLRGDRTGCFFDADISAPRRNVARRTGLRGGGGCAARVLASLAPAGTIHRIAGSPALRRRGSCAPGHGGRAPGVTRRMRAMRGCADIDRFGTPSNPCRTSASMRSRPFAGQG